MAPPANDNRSSAQLVPVGSYWGSVFDGTTVDATEDAGGPVDGFGAQDVFYYWSTLPAGNVYIYVQPKPAFGPAGSDTYFEAGTFSGAPTDWDSADGFPDGFGSGGAGSGTCRFQHWHTGGPLTLVVYTYTGDSSGSDIEFDFGWGHDQDATASHWSGNQTESFSTITTIETDLANTTRGVKQTYTAPVGGLSVPGETLGTCAFENARDGVVDIPSPTSYGCSYIGPGAGTTASGLADLPQSVGTYYRAQGVPSIPPNPDTTGRSDRVGVDQTVMSWRYPNTGRGPLGDEHAVEPDGFSAYQASNEGVDAALVWGWDFEGVSPAYETRNYYLGDFTLTNAFTTSVDVQDDVDVALYRLDASVAYNDSGTVDAAEDRVVISTGNPTVASYVLPATTASGSNISDLADLTTTAVTIASGAAAEALMIESAVDLDGDRWIVAAAVTHQVLDDTPPTFGDPPRSGQFVTIGNRTLAAGGTPSYESRLPSWRAFIGFPLVPVVAGWRVGRAGWGTSPW